ncbi:MAG: AAA ATPase domain-containing protein [Treponematales bacterium]
MIQAVFFLRFRSQLSRTRPEAIDGLDAAFMRAARLGGGWVSGGRRVLVASFPEDTVGRWLDMVLLAEALESELKKNSREIAGACLVFCRDIPDYEAENLGRELASKVDGFVVWCDAFASAALSPYGRFDLKHPRGFNRLKEWKRFKAASDDRRFPYRERILEILRQGEGKNTLLAGPELMGKRDSVRVYAAEVASGVPLLFFRFGSGVTDIISFADACDPEIMDFLARGGEKETMDELFSLQTLLFRDRLKDEYSPAVVHSGRHFLLLLLEAYTVQALRSAGKPVLILENLPQADDTAKTVFREVYSALKNKQEVLILGTCPLSPPVNNEESLSVWSSIFPRIIKYSPEEIQRGVPSIAGIPPDILEVAYGISLLGRYIPSFLFSHVFEEEGLNPGMLELALDMLSALGVIDGREDPKPRTPGFVGKAESILGERKEKVRGMVRNRIMGWVDKGKINPCFNLLRILKELGGDGSQSLILKAVYSDTINGTWESMEEAMRNGQFEAIAGEEDAAAFRYIFKTQRALVFGTQEDIAAAFREQPPEQISSPGCRARVMANLSAWYLGVRNIAAAEESVKKIYMLNQTLKSEAVPVYRLFALINLSNNELNDAMDYIPFAVDEAKKNKQPDELVKASYFGAVIFFLYGNISKAEETAQKAEETARTSGYDEWADRCRFFQGRLLFETGRYAKAAEVFESLKKEAEADSEKACLLTAWIFRSKVFAAARKGLGWGKMPGEEAGDLALFSVEAACLAGNYETAAARAESLIPHLEEDAAAQNFLFTEQPDWRSGFDQCEHFLLKTRSLGLRLVTVYDALARSRRKVSINTNTSTNLYRFIREEIENDSDPNNAFYYFVHHLVLRETEAPQADKTTALSVAFKHLQHRVGRIDDAETRQAFLSENYWNKALYALAKEYKFI